MITRKNNSLVGVRAMTASVFGLALLGAAAPASAHGFSFSVMLRGTPTWIPPVYETRARTIVEPALYEERPRRIWHEPVYEERKIRVEIPAETITKRVPRYDRHGRVVGYRLVEEVVRPATYVYKTERELVRPGYYETITERVCIRPERSRTVYDEVLVQPGHWVYPRHSMFRAGRGHPDQDVRRP